MARGVHKIIASRPAGGRNFGTSELREGLHDGKIKIEAGGAQADEAMSL